MKKIAFLFTAGRKERLPEIKTGTAPSEFFYGAPELAARGYQVEYLEYEDFKYDNSPPTSFFLRLFAKKQTLEKALAQPENLAKLNSADVLIATTNGYGTALAALRKQKKLTVPVMSMSMGILEMNAPRARKEVVREIFEQITALITSNNETRYLQEQFPELKNTICNLAFGADTSFWKPQASAVNGQRSAVPYVLSIGNDPHRDYELLVKAWKPSYPQLKIITKRAINTELPANVSVLAGDWRKKFFSDEEIRSLMQGALFGILPIRDTIQPSGQSACLQMMACGKAVIISRMAGLWDEQGMRHNETCLLPTPGSIAELQAAIESLLADPIAAARIGKAAEQVVAQRFTAQIMADDLAKIIG